MANRDGFIGWETRPADGQEIEVMMPSGRIEAGTYWSGDRIDGVFEIDDGEEVDVMEVEKYASITKWRVVNTTR